MLRDIEAAIANAMPVDHPSLQRQLARVKDREQLGKPFDQELKSLTSAIERSHELLSNRQQGLPRIDFDNDLPVSERVDELIDAILNNQVIIVCGETGSGKSTQLPKICLKCGLGIRGLIGHTQPRRIAARSVASRIAQELKSPLGQDVGFKIRFTDKTNPRTYIKLMTDGILLAETQGDRLLEQYEVIILDEAHERSLNIDFLIGYLKRLLPRRPDLKVIITSATIDADRFAEHFATRSVGSAAGGGTQPDDPTLSTEDDGELQPAPVITVSGRSFPVELRYAPLDTPRTDDPNEDLPRDTIDGICSAVHELSEIDRGDILIFLPTEGDIRSTAKRLRGEIARGGRLSNTEVLPLYARLSTAEQNKIFTAGKGRRIVLATNVAESSLTVPGIRYVVDSGTARISRYAPRSKVQRLPIEAISQASADQRAGRCGRVAPGVCIRLFSEQDFFSRDRFTTPEIRRTNLASVILQTLALKLGPIGEFPFLEPPRREAIREGYKTLFEIGAVDERQQLTNMGKQLSRMPVDPRIGRMILEADTQGCLREILVIASGLEVQDPRERPAEKREAADAQHEKFKDPTSDFISFLKLWEWFHERKQELSISRLRKACQQNFLSFSRMRQWQDIHRQLLQLTSQQNLKLGDNPSDANAIHRALLAGLLSGIAMRGDAHEYLGGGGIKFHLWPGSGIFASEPKWIMATEIVETSRRYGRTVARIDPSWIEPAAKHVLKRSYSDPHWSEKNETCMAYERVTLFGLPIVIRRRVRYADIDRDLARRLFIEQGLVEGKLKHLETFIQKNLEQVGQLETLADKTRRHDLVVDPQSVYEFYEQRLPREIYDANSLRREMKARSNELNKLLTIDPDDILSNDGEAIEIDAFPDEISVGRLKLPLEYRFHPGAENDGVTLKVPKQGLAQLTGQQLGWLVPGLLEDKVIGMIRSLPKRTRRNLVPAPETAKRVIAELEYGKGQFDEVVARALSEIAQEPIQPGDFKSNKLQDHLLWNIEVIDDEGATIGVGRDLITLRQTLGISGGHIVADATDKQWHRDHITTWDFDALPEQLDIVRGGVAVPLFPTLVDQGETVSLRLYDSPSLSRRTSLAGLTRLFSIAKRRDLRTQANWLPDLDKTRLLAASLIDSKQLTSQVMDLIARLAFVEKQTHLRTREEFEARLGNAQVAISVAAQDVAKLIPKLFERYHQVGVEIESTNPEKWKESLEDIRRQVEQLVSREVLTQTPWPWLQHLPRYLDAIVFRLDRLPQTGVQKDLELAREANRFWELYVAKKQRHESEGIIDEELETFRWMIEEYRVSLFAQKLGTSESISAKRLERQWAKTV